MVNFASNGCTFCSVLYVHVFSVSSLRSWTRMSWRPRQHASGHVTWTLSGTTNASRRERVPVLWKGLEKHPQRAALVSCKSGRQQRQVGQKLGGEAGVLAAE